MQPEQKFARRYRWLWLAGLALIGVALFVPGSRHHKVFGFVSTFNDGAWDKFFEWSAARGDVRIILLCVGLFLLIDYVGLKLLWARRNGLGNLVFCLYPLPVIGLLVGGYYLLKSLF